MPKSKHGFRSHWNEHLSSRFYGSVDIRNAGYKISSIDMNLFPGGFNNLNPNFIPLAAVAAQDAVQRACETAKSVLIIPENHTRNTFYLAKRLRPQRDFAFGRIRSALGQLES